MNSRIAILGYGNQGRPWALNLRDSGWSVTILARPHGPSATRAAQDGFNVDPPDRLGDHPVIALLIPDDEIANFAKDHGARLRGGQSLLFAHGYALHFRTAHFPDDVDLILLAPKGIGVKVREEFLAGRGVPSAISVHRDASGNARSTLEAVARGLGSERAGLYPTSVREEVETDLFSEQALLCGGIPALVHKAFEILVAKGVDPKIAYLECVHELGFMAELFQRRGFHRTLQGASPTAIFGGAKAAPRIVDSAVVASLESLYDDIHAGRFAKNLADEASRSYPSVREYLRSLREDPLEAAGHAVRQTLYPGEEP